MTWLDNLAKLEKSIIDAHGIEESKPIALALVSIAYALHRIADTQEPLTITQSKGPVSFSIAHFEDQPDGQTIALRELSRKSRERGEDEAS